MADLSIPKVRFIEILCVDGTLISLNINHIVSIMQSDLGVIYKTVTGDVYEEKEDYEKVMSDDHIFDHWT